MFREFYLNLQYSALFVKAIRHLFDNVLVSSKPCLVLK